MAVKCETCIFHPGNRMHLKPGRVKEMVEEVNRVQGFIPCHDTLPGNPLGVKPAVCKGMAEHPVMGERSIVLRLGKALGILVEFFLPTDKSPGQPKV